MSVKETLKKQLLLAFQMLDNTIGYTPDHIWDKKSGGFVYWQQIVHAITGSLFWLRTENSRFQEPYAQLKIYPELEKDPENKLTKRQVRELLNQAVKVAEFFFNHLDEDNLLEPSFIYNKTTHLSVILGQVAHLNYHIGHCESILRERGVTEIKWIDNFKD